MSRYLKGKEVMPETSLKPYLDLTDASPEQQQQACALMRTINGASRGQTPAEKSALTGEQGHASGYPVTVSSARPAVAKWGMVLRVGLVAAIFYPLLVAATLAPSNTALTDCAGPTSPTSTAWAATCTGQAVFNRTQRSFTLFDFDADGRSVLVEIRLNGGEVVRRYNSTGITINGEPPKTVVLPSIDDHTTVTFRVCLVDRNGKRGLEACGRWITDLAR